MNCGGGGTRGGARGGNTREPSLVSARFICNIISEIADIF